MRGLGGDIARQLADRYQLHGVEVTQLDTLVNDVSAISAAEGKFALKLYHRNRTRAAVQWETDLVIHLVHRGAPVAPPIRGRNGYVETFVVDGQQRIAVLSPWAPGTKPAPSAKTYTALGEAAARIHRAADGFAPSPARESYDVEVLIDDQLRRMKEHLEEAGVRQPITALAERLKDRLADSPLDQGICHMDLTLDNVHVADQLTVFDFDSAGTCWRAVEPWGVLRFSDSYFQAWLSAYRTVRPFGPADTAAVAAFGIVADLRVVAWKLGVAASSRGAPLLTSGDLPAIVDNWLQWEARHIT